MDELPPLTFPPEKRWHEGNKKGDPKADALERLPAMEGPRMERLESARRKKEGY